MRELEDSMPASEAGEWLMLYEQEPWGDVRADLRSAIVSHTVARALGGNKNVRVLDFMPQFREPAPPPRAQLHELEGGESASVRARNANAERETHRLMAIFDSVVGRNSKRKIIQRRRPQ